MTKFATSVLNWRFGVSQIFSKGLIYHFIHFINICPWSNVCLKVISLFALYTKIPTGSLVGPALPLRTFCCASSPHRLRPRPRMSADGFQHVAHLHPTVRSRAGTAEQGRDGASARNQHEDEQRREKHHGGTCVIATDRSVGSNPCVSRARRLCH